MNIFKSTVFQFTLLLGLFAGIGGTLLYINQKEIHPVSPAPAQVPGDGIADFNYQRDSAYINAIFESDDNWHWLVEGTRDQFSPDQMMKTLSSTRSPNAEHNLIIKMLYVAGKPAGFLAYFMRNFFTGEIRFVYVDPAYRGAGYGVQLVNYAVDQLKREGAAKIVLVTRTTNLPALRIYEKAGFSAEPSREGFVYLAKRLI